ncbi:hypothetical protein JZ751_011972 [Albula glossodonta]|uniref:V-type proton ATPase subunit G n=1 Tax=Albula glossodonta TaxID=121402 RepID=A0A8T2PR96_9TELE|nr:hypothetical protein JZ751_011972 [Albula glossodonta]
MASQSQGIQQLLQAEKRAAEKVAEARKREVQQLPIEQYRLQREKEFKTKEAAALGSHGSSAVEVDKETIDKMQRIQGSYQQNCEIVLGNLLKMVCDIKPEIHTNYRVAG